MQGVSERVFVVKMCKRVSICLLAMILLLSCGAFSAFALENEKTVLAHWKLQNNAAYYKGSIEADTLQFYDLSGNGNDLEVAVEGKGDELDTFVWDSGVTRTDDGLKNGDGNTSSLKLDNSLTKAQSVDPYDASQTAFSGAYVSGKYLQTVEGAPLNAFVGTNGWTIEVIFKVSADWDNRYNRYTGVFSRQGVVAQYNEPSLSLALSCAQDNVTQLGENNAVGLQYVHVTATGHKFNKEHSALMPDQWCHYMVANDGIRTRVYVDGVCVLTFEDSGGTTIVDPDFRWEVGVGRKTPGSGDKTMNAAHAEGVIRRLFCGSVSEIRVTDGEIGVQDSLLFTVDTVETTTTSTRGTTTSTRATTTKATTTESKPTTVTRGEITTTAPTQGAETKDTTVPSVGETDTQSTGADVDNEVEADTEPVTTAKRKTQIMVQHRPINTLWILLVVGAELVAALVAAVIGMWILRKKKNNTKPFAEVKEDTPETEH